MPRSSRSVSSRPSSHRYADRLRTARSRTRSPTRSLSRPRSRSRSPARSRSNSPRPLAGPSNDNNNSHNTTPGTVTINRELTTPFLLHLCYRFNAFHNLVDFPVPLAPPPSSSAHSNSRPSSHIHLPAHLQIYTWMSCTLRELAQLLTATLPGIMPRPAAGTRLAFRLVYPDTSPSSKAGGRLGGGADGGADDLRGRYVSREMGSVVVGVTSTSSLSSDVAGGNDNVGARQQQHPWDLGGDEASKTLEDVRFMIGDFVDCAVFPPLSDGSVVARSTAMGYGSGNGFGGPGGRRELNGFGRRPSRGGGGGGGGAYGRARAGVGSGGGETLPSGEWRRGERLPDRGLGGGSSYGRPRPRH